MITARSVSEKPSFLRNGLGVMMCPFRWRVTGDVCHFVRLPSIVLIVDAKLPITHVCYREHREKSFFLCDSVSQRLDCLLANGRDRAFQRPVTFVTRHTIRLLQRNVQHVQSARRNVPTLILPEPVSRC